MSSKIRIRIEDIASHSILPYNIYDKNNRLICRKGDVIDSKALSRLSLMEIFKMESDESFNSLNILSRISKQTSEFVINYTKDFLEAAEKGDTNSIEAVYAVRDRLLDEVLEHINHIQHIGELRIYYDDYYLSHGINVCTLSTALGIKLGYEKDNLKELSLGGLLHDIGKIKIPKQILNKPTQLTAKEFEVIKLHSPLGYKVIKEEYGLPETIAKAALDHQERYDGSGYMRALVGDKINKNAQIIALADVYDASSSNKVYAQAKNPKQVIKELLKQSQSFNPRVLYTLVHMVNYNTGDLKQKIEII